LRKGILASILLLVIVLASTLYLMPVHAEALTVTPSCILPGQPQTITVSVTDLEPRYSYPLLVTFGQDQQLMYQRVVFADSQGNINTSITLPPLSPGYYEVLIWRYTTALVVGGCPITTITTVTTLTSTVSTTVTTTLNTTYTATVATSNVTVINIVGTENVTLTNTTTIWVNETDTTTHWITYTVGPAILAVTPMNYSYGVVATFTVTGKGFLGNETVSLITPGGTVYITTDPSGSFIYTNQWAINADYFDFYATGQTSGLGSNVVTVTAMNPQLHLCK
jgi:hypothetical protein